MTPGTAFAASLLRASSRAYASATVHRLRLDAPAAVTAELPSAFADPVADNEVRILQLAESLAVARPELFGQALRWYRVAFAARSVPARYLPTCVAALRATLATELPEACRQAAVDHLDASATGLASWPEAVDSLLAGDGRSRDLARRYLLAVLESRGDDALALLAAALADGADVAAVHDDVLTPVQREVGRMWLMAEIPIADERYGSAITARALDLLQSRIPRPAADAPRVLTFGVGGNLHDLGIRVVAQRLQLDGWEVIHLGGNLPPEDLEWFFADRRVDLIAISATMLLHLGTAAATVARLRAALRDACPPILLGGEPFAQVPDLHAALGGDASAGDAAGAVVAARALLGGRQRCRSK